MITLPVQYSEACIVEPYMTRRDLFAVAALQGYLAGRINFSESEKESYKRDMVAKSCYAYADAMLAEREKEEQP